MSALVPFLVTALFVLVDYCLLAEIAGEPDPDLFP